MPRHNSVDATTEGPYSLLILHNVEVSGLYSSITVSDIVSLADQFLDSQSKAYLDSSLDGNRTEHILNAPHPKESAYFLAGWCLHPG